MLILVITKRFLLICKIWMLDISDKDEDLFWVYWDFELCDNASTSYLYLPDLLLKFPLDRCPYM